LLGCFFIYEHGDLKLLASRNIVLSPFYAEKFSPVREAIIDSINRNRELFLPDGGHQLTMQFSKLGIQSFIGIPVKIGESVCGCLSLGNHFGGSPFSESILPFVRMFASQIELALSYFKAYEEIREIKDRFEDETTFYRREMGLELPIEQIVGKSKAIRKVIEQVRQVAPTDSLVLITGETGVGKELVAKAVHNLSDRKDGPFIPVNLATFPQDLIASELFGYEKGAFSGATERKKGRFELADSGTIFLDEIGDLSLDIQVKLLRVLQEGTFERLGGSKPIQSNFRVVTATNRDLQLEVKNGTFRQDLYYRLNVFPIHVPPLRKRREDVEMLARHFFHMFDKKLEKNINHLPAGELKKLKSYPWPGNVRELKHFIERAVILSNGYNISFSGLEAEKPRQAEENGRTVVTLADAERAHIESALKATYWRISGAEGAAALLGLPPSTLRNKMKKLGIGRPQKHKGQESLRDTSSS
jgi:formate hydrogenlyase transcriptional activator